MMEMTTARLAIVGPRKGQLFVFDRADTTVKHASACLKPGQRLVVATISWDNSPETERASPPQNDGT